jgi:hypothetical protein
MRCDDLSIWTTTSARAGENADVTTAIAAADASRTPNTLVIITPALN